MRPIKLTMQAFGPYADKTVIDMEKLGGKGVYLITGDTGSGKTTIFDAVCYALFGKASGDSRLVRMFRSEYAPLDRKTYVEMVFEYNGVRYLVHREPNQKTAKKRGEGITDLNTTNELYIIGQDKPIASTETRVNEEIHNILGLDREQYRNVAMIAQGSFAQVLTLKTDDRTDILRAIFSTDKYRRLQEELRLDANTSMQCYKNSELRISTILESMKLSKDDPYRDEIASLSEDPEAAAENGLEELCGKALEYEKKNAADASGAYRKANEKSKAAQLALESAKALKDLHTRLEASKKELNELVPKLKAAKEKSEEQEKLRPVLNELIGKIASRKNELTRYDEADNTLKDADRINARVKKLVQECNELKEQIGKNEHMREQHGKFIAETKDTAAELTKIRYKISEQKQELEHINRIGMEIAEVEKLEKTAEKAHNEFKSKETDYYKIERYSRQLFDLYISDQAGVIAHQLKDGCPCPVCGSLEHPAPAHTSNHAPDKAAVDKADSDVVKARKEYESAAQAYSTAKANFESRRDNAVKNAGIYGEGCTLSQALDNARKSYAKVNDAKKSDEAAEKSLRETLDKREKSEKALVQLDELISKQKEEFTARDNERLTLSVNAENLIKSARELLEKLPCKSRAEAAAKVEELEKQRTSMEKAMDEAANRLKELTTNETALKGKITELEEQTKGKSVPDCEVLEAELRTARDEEKAALAVHEEATGCFNNVSETVKKLIRELNANRDLRREHSMKRSLASTANGTLSGKQRVTLETYVQMEYFDRILSLANIRLLKMTSGQYELVRSDNTSGNTKVGLDIDVKDHYTGSVRSVKSLSGGESFMASLALALGFSDEIQQTSGSVSIDSMFVDEGFGSLDDDTLNQAIKVLYGLAENSRLVGLISHVPELKEKLDKQMIVTKDKATGSSVTIVT